jgi:hypothetical protein
MDYDQLAAEFESTIGATRVAHSRLQKKLREAGCVIGDSSDAATSNVTVTTSPVTKSPRKRQIANVNTDAAEGNENSPQKRGRPKKAEATKAIKHESLEGGEDIMDSAQKCLDRIEEES